MIRDGRVRVEGQLVRRAGAKVDPDGCAVTVDGKRLARQGARTFVLNKPRGFVCSNARQGDKHRVIDLFPEVRERLFTAGRLDEDSEGLLVVTNDGTLSEALTHPRYEVPKTYRVTVAGRVDSEAVGRISRGVHLAERKTVRAKVRVVRKGRKTSTLEITVREGANREVRRMCARVGLAVKRLVRTRIGKLTVARLPKGMYRQLTRSERAYCAELRRRVLERQAGKEK